MPNDDNLELTELEGQSANKGEEEDEDRAGVDDHRRRREERR